MPYLGQTLFRKLLANSNKDFIVYGGPFKLVDQTSGITEKNLGHLLDMLVEENKIKKYVRTDIGYNPKEGEYFQLDRQAAVTEIRSILENERRRRTKKFKVASIKTGKLRKGKVYLIKCSATKALKIGWTEDPVEKRMQTINHGNPYPLEIVTFFSGTKRDEKAAHKLFHKHHLRGEWFQFSDDIVKYFHQRLEATERLELEGKCILCGHTTPRSKISRKKGS